MHSASENSSAPLAVDIVTRHAAWEAAGLAAEPLIAAAGAAFAAAGPNSGQFEVAVVLTDDAEMRVLNRTWRGQDQATNVLSFRGPDDQDAPVRALGDVVLALETLDLQAEEMGIPLMHHAQHLVVHGILHLLGQDHATEAEALEMEGRESRIMLSLGLPDPYARELRPETAS